MSMTELRVRPQRKSLTPYGVWFGVFAAYVALLAVVPPMLERAPRSEFEFVNDTAWTLGVETVRGDGRSPITHLRRRNSKVVQEVSRPPGEEWVLRWTFAGEEVGITRLPIDPDDAESFEVGVPQSVVDRLRAIDAPPTP